MGEDPVRRALLGIEGLLEGGERTEGLSALAYIAGRRVAIDEDTLSGARRRAMLLLAAGGDPHRELDLDGRAVRALAADVDDPARRAQLAEGLAELLGEAIEMELVTAAMNQLAAEPNLAWRAFACALLAEELAGDA